MGSNRIFMIGAGAAGAGLAGALSDAGLEVVGLWTRSGKRADAVRKRLPMPVFAGPWPEPLDHADLVIVAVPDAAIGPVAQALASSGRMHDGQVALHLSGSVPVEALGPLRGKVKGVGLCHPLFPFGPVRKPDALRGAGFGVAGDPEAVRAAETLVSRLGAFSFPLPGGENLAPYHAAAAVASNFVTALLDLSERLFGEAGIGEKDARRALVPLARAALDNVSERGPVEGLTGPFRRGDVETVRKHLEALKKLGPKELRAYAALGLLTLGMSRQLAEAEPSRLSEIEALLNELISLL